MSKDCLTSRFGSQLKCTLDGSFAHFHFCLQFDAVCSVSSVCISLHVYEEKWSTLIRCRNHIHCHTNTCFPPLEGKDVISLNYFDKRSPENIHKLPLSFKHLNRREWFPFYIIYIVESTFVWPSSVSLSFVKTISTSSYFVQGLYRGVF